jgi:hypothetical protein
METESEKRYMKDPMANTVEGFIKGLHILSRFMKADLGTAYFCEAEQDIIYIYTEDGGPAEDSKEGLKLSELGFHYEEELWAYYT